MKKMRPLTPNQEALEESFTKAFCATLPSEREVAAASKAFCATLPGDFDPAEMTKAFCATLPSEKVIRKSASEALRPFIEEDK